MSRCLLRMVPALGTLVLLASAAPASAQWQTAACDCATPAAAPVHLSAAPIAAGCDPCGSCATSCLQPVMQTCYQSVPVTEYRPVRKTVQRPVVETAYVDQPITAYRPVCEQKTVEVPTVHYQTVSECQTVTRDCGYWATYCQPNCKVAPCQYDPRANFSGWLNRTSYSIREAFRPDYKVHRQWVSRPVAQTVPVTRQVAVRGTRQVAYNVTRMVPYQTTQKVAVRTVRYVAEEVTAMEAVTVMRTVPTGTQVAWVNPYAAGPTATALAPSPDPISSAARPGDLPKRTADSRDQYDREHDVEPRRFDRDRKADSFDDRSREPFTPTRPSSYRAPAEPAGYQAEDQFPQASHRTNYSGQAAAADRPAPSIVRVNRWVPTSRISDTDTNESGPRLTGPSISIAGTEY